MKKALLICIAMLTVLAQSVAPAGDIQPIALPSKQLLEQVAAESAFVTPGVHTLRDSPLVLLVGEGKVAGSLGEARAKRLAHDMAEHDAIRRLAAFLYPGEQGVLLEMSGQQAVTTFINTKTNKLYLGITVDPAKVKRIERTAAMVFSSCRNLQLHPLVMEEMAALPTLLDGGGHIFESPDGWMAVGVGFADIKTPGDSASERDARKIARVNATKELSEVIFGAWMEVMEADGSAFAETGAGGNFLEWSVKHNRESVTGEFVNLEIAGSWSTDDDEMAVVAVLSEPRLSWEGVVRNTAAEPPDVADVDMPEEWEEVFSLRPQWWKGGTGVAAPGGKPMAVAIGAARLRNDPAYDRIQAPMAAELDARRNFLKYFAGFTSATVTTDTESIRETFSDAGVAARVENILQKTARENSKGAVRVMNRVGGWKSGDKKLLYAAYAIDLESLAGK